MDQPRVRYAREREPALAFQVLGDGGGIDVVSVTALMSHVELTWEEPTLARVSRRLGALGRLVLYDRRGSGLSDHASPPWTVADEVDDLVAVMDAADIERAAVITTLTGGSIGCLLAAMYPGRVASLVLDTCTPRQSYADDYEWALTPERREKLAAGAAREWGEGDFIATFAPTWAADPVARAWMGRLERLGSSPGRMRKLWSTMDAIDVRAALPSIQAPTLVVRRTGDTRIDRRHALYLAKHVAGARLVELAGQDSIPWGEGGDSWVDLVGEFVAGAAPPAAATRALATLLFTDIVDSTTTVARIGDTRWRALLEQHDACAQRAIAGARGRIVKRLGDGVFARFDTVPDAVMAARRLIGDVVGLGIAIRAGVHVGDCELVGDDLAGRTVHEAARIAALASPGEVLLSEAALGLLPGSEIATSDRGLHNLKGFDQAYRLYGVT